MKQKIGVVTAGILLAACFGMAAADDVATKSTYQQQHAGNTAADSNDVGPPPGFAERQLPATKSTYQSTHPVSQNPRPRGPFDPV
jgi:hypothetical protein